MFSRPNGRSLPNPAKGFELLAHRNADSSESIRSSSGSPGCGTKPGHSSGAGLVVSVTLQRGELALQRALVRGEPGELGEIAAPSAALLAPRPARSRCRAMPTASLSPLGEIERLDQRQRLAAAAGVWA